MTREHVDLTHNDAASSVHPLPRKRGREQTEFAARLAPAATAESRVP
jgi:hypothetical protein